MNRIRAFRYCLFACSLFLCLRPALAQKTDSLVLINAVLYYHTYGSGVPIIVLSGGPGISAQQESDMVDELKKNYQVILFEQRGTGRSWTKPMDSTTINLATAINDLELLRKRLDIIKVNFCGHSWGAMLAEAYTARYPDRTGLMVLIGSGETNRTYYDIVNESIDVRWQMLDDSTARYWADSVNSKRDPQKARMELRKAGLYAKIYDRKKVDTVFAQVIKGDLNRTMNRFMYRSLLREGFPLDSALRAYKGPVLIVFGWQDPIGSMTFYPLKQAMPQAEVQGINQCGHFPAQEQPQKFFGIVNEFLARHLSKAKNR